jgi:hypothetical protein
MGRRVIVTDALCRQAIADVNILVQAIEAISTP